MSKSVGEPNSLLIKADDPGYGDLSRYGVIYASIDKSNEGRISPQEKTMGEIFGSLKLELICWETEMNKYQQKANQR
jgi:hypothetical protein